MRSITKADEAAAPATDAEKELQELHSKVFQWGFQIAPECKPCTGAVDALVGDEESDDGNEGDDEHAMMEGICQFAHKVSTGPKPSQKERKQADKAKPKPLTKQQIKEIVNAVKQGKIQLPKIEDHTDDDWMAIWALMDAGSAVHVADLEKHLPGVKVRESAAQKCGVRYQCANGGEIPNKGEGLVRFKTEAGIEKTIVVQNAEVGMPIISTNKLAKEQNDIVYRADDGYILHLPTGQRTPFVARDGVYFVQMRIPNDLATGFQRRG